MKRSLKITQAMRNAGENALDQAFFDAFAEVSLDLTQDAMQVYIAMDAAKPRRGRFSRIRLLGADGRGGDISNEL